MSYLGRSLILFLLVLSFASPSLAQNDLPTTLDIPTTDKPQFDPLLAYDKTSVMIAENLFLGLTDVDPVTGQIVPELATDWTVSEDGLTWTFTLRSDVNWVQYDTAGQAAVPVRPVVADDVVYGIKRACDPRLESAGNSYAVASYVVGCQDLLWAAADEMTDDAVFGDTVGVSAPDDTTVMIQLLSPTPNFQSLAANLALRAVPADVVQANGANWTPQAVVTEASCTVSSGSTVNLRAEPSASAERAGGLAPNESVAVVAQVAGADGFTWWMVQLSDGEMVYVRSDVVDEQGECDSLPDVADYDPAAIEAPLSPFLTNGPYVLVNHNAALYTFARNADLPADLQGPGNIDEVNLYMTTSFDEAQALYTQQKLDSAPLSGDDLANPDQFGEGNVYALPQATAGMLVFDHAQPPFDDVYARRAFSAIIDRNAFVDQVLDGAGKPMTHLIPAGTPGGPAADTLDSLDFMNFNPEIAFSSLAQGGYSGCGDLPPITVVASGGTLGWGEFWKAAAEDFLGCDPQLMNVEQVEFSVLLQAASSGTSAESKPNAWTMNWTVDYGDANEWLLALGCGDHAPSGRSCGPIDDLIDQARTAPMDERAELYAEIENAFFGPEGEFPVAPIFLRSDYQLMKTWYTGPFETDGLYGGSHWGSQSIDMAAKLAARGE